MCIHVKTDIVRNVVAEENTYSAKLDRMYPQTSEELAAAKELLPEELKRRGLTGIPSKDRVWRHWYTQQQLTVAAPQMSLTDYLYEKNKKRLDLCAINYRGKKITYEELFFRIEDTAKRFQKYGVKEGDYVNLALPIAPETIYMIYGLDKIGGCASLIDPRVNEERMAYYLNLVKSHLVGITGIYAHTMRNVVAQRKNTFMLNISPLQSFSSKKEVVSLKLLYRLKTAHENIREFIFNLQQSVNHNRIISSKLFFAGEMNNESLYIPPYRDNRTAIVEYTSGTTGVPKGLELSAASINLVVEQLIDLIQPQAGDSMLGIMPPFISYGMVCGLHAGLSSGFELITIPTFTPEIFPELVLKHKPNMIICVPNFLQRLMSSPVINKKINLSFIKYLIVGGDKMNITFELKFKQWLKQHKCDVTVTKGGGMAEYASCLFYTPYEKSCKPGVYGLPLPAVDAKIVDENDNELGYYEVGEIYVSSPQAMNGYVNDPIATGQFFCYDSEGKKYGRSGDLGYVDINGLFTLVDRKKQMLIRPDGHNVFPAEISNVINQHPAVVNCLVTGIQESKFDSGVWPTAFIQIFPEYLVKQAAILKEIRRLCEKKLPPRDRPRDKDYILVKEIITTTEGKIDKNATIESINWI